MTHSVGSHVKRYAGHAADRLAILLAAYADQEADTGMVEGPYMRLLRHFEMGELRPVSVSPPPPKPPGPRAPSAMDAQVGGDHYKGTLQPWEVTRAWKLGPWRMNVLKYLQRAPKKNGKQDLEKARHYLDYLIENYDDLLKEGLL